MAHSESAASEEADSSPTNSNTPPGKALVAGRRLRGLSWNKTHQLWRVRIYYAGKLRFVGRFQDAVAAAKAYDKAAVYLYGANAITNFGLEACLADPTEVGSCIVRAKEEAEHAAANRQAGSSSQGSAPAANASGSSHSPSSSMSSSSLHILGLDGLVAGVATQQWQQQQQQQKYTLQESMQLLGAHVLPATAAAAVSGHSVSCALPTAPQPYHHQQQYPTAVTSTLSLDANSNSTATISAATADEDAAAAAGSNGDSLAAMNSADQACLLQLLLDAQQQQQVLGLYTHESLHSSPQPALVPGVAPTAAAAAAAACHQLFSQQPQVFQLAADNAIGAVYNPAASDGTAAAGRLLYAAEPAAYLGNLQQQQYSLEQQIQLLSISNHCAEQYHSVPCNDNFSTAAAAAAGSTGFLGGTRLGNITCISATARGGSTYCSDAAAGCIPTCDWQYRPC